MKNAAKWRLEQFRGCLVDSVKLLWLYLLMGFVLAVSLSWAFGRNALGSVVSVQEQSGTGPYSLPCVLMPAPKVALRCMRFEEHLYAVADVNLQTEEIVFATSDDKRMETFPEVVSNLSIAGVKPILVTNAGIYGTDNRPLGLLISPKGKLHNVNTAAGSGNFSWDSAVFQISDDGTASIVPARSWQDNPHTIAATQSGPQLAGSGKINQSFQPQSKWSFRRTSIGIDQSNRRLVRLVVSREPVTLFELATFMVKELHCSEALHLDGDLSAFYVPASPPKFIFADPGERIVTVLSILEKKRN
jgi:uncharacterized protein YigE (DUF2233 family)